MTDRIVVGVDGGGTKTDVVVAGEHGDVLGTASGGPANWEGVGLDAMTTTLDDAIGAALDDAGRDRGEVSASAFCLAGVDWPSDHSRVDPHLDTLGLGGVRRLTNDSFAALRAGTPSTSGCVSIAGTGGVAAGRNAEGVELRTMGIGWGEGKGAWGLVEAALHFIAAAEHGSAPPTRLAQLFVERSGSTSVLDMFETFSRRRFAVDSEYAPLVMAAARDGDESAARSCRWAGSQHGADVSAIARRLGMHERPFDLVLAGGLHLNAAPDFSEAFASAVADRAPGARPSMLIGPPAAGAALLALEIIGIATSDLFDRIVREAATATHDSELDW